MAEVRFNGSPVVRATISMPRHGAWIADVEVASPTAAEGLCVIDVEGMRFNGAIRRGGSFQNVCKYTVIGGTNGLRTQLPARFYADVPLSIPIRDLLSECSQPIAASASVPATTLRKWARMASSGAAALEALLAVASASWRILDDGTIWYGAETWPDVTVAASVLDADPSVGWLQVAAAMPAFRPGTTWRGGRISYVVHKLAPSSSRTELWLE